MDVSSRDVRSRAELLALLGGRRALARALAEQTWQRVLRDAYVPAGPVDLAVRAHAARRLLPERSLVGDRSVLWLLGVDVLPPGPPVLEVVVAPDVVRPRRQGVRARQTDLPRRDRCTLRGAEGPLPVLRPARAVGDLLRLLPPVEAVVVADAVQHAGVCTRADLQTEVDGQARRRHVVRAREALALSDGRAESPPETRLRLLLVGAGLRPQPQVSVCDDAGRWVARVDLGFERERVALEYDGLAVHSTRDAFVADRRRQNALVRAGWTVLRYSAQDLRDSPEQLVQDVLHALARAAEPGAPQAAIMQPGHAGPQPRRAATA